MPGQERSRNAAAHVLQLHMCIPRITDSNRSFGTGNHTYMYMYSFLMMQMLCHMQTIRSVSARKYNAHINVEVLTEVATSISAVKYLFKYIYKVSDRPIFMSVNVNMHHEIAYIL